MTNLDRLKQRLVGDAISENLDLIAGRRRQRAATRPRRRLALPLLVGALGVLATTATLALTGVVPLDLPPALAKLAAQAGLRLPARPASLVAAGAALPAPVAGAAPLADSDHGLVEPSRQASITAAGDGSEPGSGEAPADGRRYDAPTKLDLDVFPLGVRRVVVDPGHGGGDLGASAGDLLEKDITLSLGRRLSDLLVASGFQVAMTRADDVQLALADRVAFANEQRGDVFVSIHVNWLGRRAFRGIETFYLGPTDDPDLKQMTSEENLESGYSLTDFRRLLAGVYEDVRGDESKTLAASVHRSLYQRLRAVSPELKDRGVKTAPFVVLIGTEMPAVLAEVGSLSDQEEVLLLRDAEYQQRIAEALRDGVIAYASRLEPHRSAPTGADPAPVTVTAARAGGGR